MRQSSNANLEPLTPPAKPGGSPQERADIAVHGVVDNSMQDPGCLWQHYSFHLESDAWVIVSARKQLVGFAYVWHRDHEEFYTFICVHPQYRKRGIGMLLLRMAEQRARELR